MEKLERYNGFTDPSNMKQPLDYYAGYDCIRKGKYETVIYSPLTTCKPKPQKKRKPPYKKPSSIKQLELDLYQAKRLKHPNNPAVLKPNLRDDSANGLTDCICKYLNFKGFFAARINTMGNYNHKLKKWVYSGAKRGMADINAVVYGRSFSIEIKIGKDKPRPDQLKVKAEVEAAGGVYIFVTSFDDFLKQFNEVANNYSEVPNSSELNTRNSELMKH